VSEFAVTLATKFGHYISLNSPDDRTFDHVVLLSVAMATNITSNEEQYNGNVGGKLLLKMPSVLVSRMLSARREARHDCLVDGPMWALLHVLHCGSLLECRMIGEWSYSCLRIDCVLNGQSEKWILVSKTR
jgi:hypothetical protein